MNNTIYAPWTEEVIARLNKYQTSREGHPYTCNTRHDNNILVATKDGWTCPGCDYKQEWAYDPF